MLLRESLTSRSLQCTVDQFTTPMFKQYVIHLTCRPIRHAWQQIIPKGLMLACAAFRIQVVSICKKYFNKYDFGYNTAIIQVVRLLALEFECKNY